MRQLAPDGHEAWRQVVERGYEGYVAKDRGGSAASSAQADSCSGGIGSSTRRARELQWERSAATPSFTSYSCRPSSSSVPYRCRRWVEGIYRRTLRRRAKPIPRRPQWSVIGRHRSGHRGEAVVVHTKWHPRDVAGDRDRDPRDAGQVEASRITWYPISGGSDAHSHPVVGNVHRSTEMAPQYPPRSARAGGAGRHLGPASPAPTGSAAGASRESPGVPRVRPRP